MKKELGILEKAINTLSSNFPNFPNLDHIESEEKVGNILNEVALAMQDNYPYFSPKYAGQMLKPPHVVARLAYMLSLYINPNNHALDGSRASSPMENECIRQLADMFGWDSVLGHLTSGGTVANLEALWIAHNCRPDSYILASEFAHYTHQRISGVLNIPFHSIDGDSEGKMDIEALNRALDKFNTGTVVVTLGTTGMGAIDPLEDVIKLQSEYGFRIHVDAAYGGYFGIASEVSEYVSNQYGLLDKVDSIVIDPHKHGLQPYGCGCVLFKDPRVGAFYKHDSPYTYFTSDELHLGEISLECSRAGASAVALWATMKMFPLVKNGDFSHMLDASLRAAQSLYKKIKENEALLPLHEPELDIVVWAFKGERLSQMTTMARDFFNFAAASNIHLALFKQPVESLPSHWNVEKIDEREVLCIRTCLMKPEHEGFIDELWMLISQFILKP